jgi:hypothetical protein
MSNELMSLDEIMCLYPAHGVNSTNMSATLLRRLCNTARAANDIKPTIDTRENLSSWPEKIYLQIHDEDENIPLMCECSLEDVTWCIDSVSSCEIEYVRADLVKQFK